VAGIRSRYVSRDFCSPDGEIDTRYEEVFHCGCIAGEEFLMSVGLRRCFISDLSLSILVKNYIDQRLSQFSPATTEELAVFRRGVVNACVQGIGFYSH